MNINISKQKFYLILVIMISSFFCLYNLSINPITTDETIYINVINNFFFGDSWMPRYFDSPFIEKPPLTLYLTLPFLKIFGAKFLSYRLVSGLAGIGTCIILYYLSFLYFESFFFSFLTVLALLSSEVFLFGHVARQAVNDSLLVFFTTGCLYFYINFLEDKNHSKIFISSFFGMLATLAKSFAGIFPLMIIPFCIFLKDKHLFLNKEFFKKNVIFLIIFLLPVSLFYSIFILFDDFFLNQFNSQFIDRFKEGYHHSENYFYYFDNIFYRKKFIPPFLLFLGLLISFFSYIKSKKAKYLYLIIWVLIPFLVYSYLNSRLNWYLAPVIPAMAILAVLPIKFVVNFFHDKNFYIKCTSFLLATLFLFLLSKPLFYNSRKILNFKPEKLHVLLSDVLENKEFISKDFKIYMLGSVALNKKINLNLKNVSNVKKMIKLNSLKELKNMINKKSNLLIIKEDDFNLIHDKFNDSTKFYIFPNRLKKKVYFALQV